MMFYDTIFCILINFEKTIRSSVENYEYSSNLKFYVNPQTCNKVMIIIKDFLKIKDLKNEIKQYERRFNNFSTSFYFKSNIFIRNTTV